MCLPGAATVCDDGNLCTKDSCSAQSGCIFAPLASGPCDDANVCTNQTCSAGVCKASPPKKCDDTNPCTKDSCDAIKGCANVPAQGACNDGNKCTAGDACVNGNCKPGAVKSCEDNKPCTVDACDSKTGTCTHKPGNAIACNDGNACTDKDVCNQGVCKPGKAKSCDDTNPCTKDQCNPKNATCNNTKLADKTNCGPGKWCMASKCVPRPTCSNLSLDSQKGETCDDGGLLTNDGCSPKCKLQTTLSEPLASDYARLTKGVVPLLKPGTLSTFVLHKRNAFAVLTDADKFPLVAAARHGKGRVAVVPHESFLGSGALNAKDGRPALAINLAKWLTANKAKAVVGVTPNFKAYHDALKKAGVNVKLVKTGQLSGLDVYINAASSTAESKHAKAIVSFVANGGGVLTAGQAWWWGSQNGRTNVPLKYPGNTWLNPMGITYTWDWVKPDKVEVGKIAPHLWTNAWVALRVASLHVRKLAKLTLGQRKIAAATASEGVRVLPLGFNAFYTDSTTFQAHYTKNNGPVVPTKSKPLVRAKVPLAELSVRIDEKRALSLPASKLWAHPAGKDFPGAPSASAKKGSTTLTVDATFTGLSGRFAYSNPKSARRFSTGLYAAPGQVVQVTIPANIAGKGLRAMVGAHSDSLWKKTSWWRMPKITRTWVLSKTVNEIGNVFGGPVYVLVAPGLKLGKVKVTVSGGYLAPRFIAGTTKLDDWKKTIRLYGSPWAELAGKHIVLTIPASLVRKLDDPAAVTKLWDDIMTASYNLAGLPNGRARGERAVADRQISAGWLHSGYPVMGHLATAPEWLDVAKVRKSGSWGLFHEIGHNFQWRDWVIPKTTEVSVNLWSVHSCEKIAVNGGCHGNAFPPKSTQLVEDFVKKGATYSAWSTWGTLQMYVQLAKGFGWGTYSKLFSGYYKIPDKDAPNTVQAKHDTFCVRFSQLVKKDLGKFFAAWAMPVSKAGCRDKVKHLAPWLQDPMRKYLPYEAALTTTAASAITSKGASVGFNIIDPGGKGAKLTAYWGNKDAGNKDASWAHSKVMGTPKAGKGSLAVAGLKSGTKHYYRLRIDNAKGSFWTGKAGSFTTK